MWFLQWALASVRQLSKQPDACPIGRASLLRAVRLRILWLVLSGAGLTGEQRRERACAVRQLHGVLRALGVAAVAWGLLFHVVGRRALRRGDRVLGLGDLFVLRQRLPSLFALLRGVLDPAEGT